MLWRVGGKGAERADHAQSTPDVPEDLTSMWCCGAIGHGSALQNGESRVSTVRHGNTGIQTGDILRITGGTFSVQVGLVHKEKLVRGQQDVDVLLQCRYVWCC